MKKQFVKLTALLSAMSMLFAAGCGGSSSSGSGGSDSTGDTSQSESEHTHNYVNGYCTICGEKDPNYSEGDITGDDAFSYYSTTKLRDDKKIYALNMEGGMDNDTLNTVSALQGLFARKEVTFYVDGKYMTNGTNADQYYLTEAEEKYGVQSENIDLETAIGMYIDAWDDMVASEIWGSKIDLETGFKDASE